MIPLLYQLSYTATSEQYIYGRESASVNGKAPRRPLDALVGAPPPARCAPERRSGDKGLATAPAFCYRLFFARENTRSVVMNIYTETDADAGILRGRRSPSQGTAIRDVPRR